MITLKPIDTENFWEVVSLSVSPEQEALVLPNAVSIAQAYVQRECIPLAIENADGVPVGFLMYCIDRDDGEYWIYRLMIDRAQQNRGYGREAMTEALKRIRQDGAHRRVYLGVDPAGAASVRLYQSLGFVFNGQVFGKEHIMVLEY